MEVRGGGVWEKVRDRGQCVEIGGNGERWRLRGRCVGVCVSV